MSNESTNERRALNEITKSLSKQATDYLVDLIADDSHINNMAIEYALRRMGKYDPLKTVDEIFGCLDSDESIEHEQLFIHVTTFIKTILARVITQQDGTC